MPIFALSVSALGKRWASKALRAAEGSLEKHFSDLIRGRVIRYHARLHHAEPEVRLAPDFDGIRTFEISFNASDWETVEDAVPKAFEQFVGGIIALASQLDLPKTELVQRCASLGIQPIPACVLPPVQPRPHAKEHPRARELLPDEIFRDRCDGYGPVGSDTGADVLGTYEEWRAANSEKGRDAFFDGLLKSWGCSEDVEDDILIAIAVAQLTFDGNVSAVIRARALTAANRQLSAPVLSYRGWDHVGNRRKALDLVRGATAPVPGEEPEQGWWGIRHPT